MKLSHYDDVHKYSKKHWWHIAKKNLINHTLKNLNATKKNKILDVGCGTGHILNSLTEYNNIYGIDSEKKAVVYCKKNGVKNVKLGNSEKINFKSNHFDFVIALDVLEHADEQKSLKEFHRVLKPGGKLIVTVPAYQWLWTKWDEILMHQKRYTKSSLNNILIENNLVINKSTYLYSFLVIPVYIIRKIKSKLYKDEYPSDLKLSSEPLINNSLLLLSKIEHILLNYIDSPFGLSVFTVAQKPTPDKKP